MSERRNEVFERDTVPAGHKRDVMRDDFGLDIPAAIVPLPSGGKVYPSSSPLFGKDSLEIKPMTAVEEDILTSRALLKKGTVISELIRSCLLTPGVDPDDMLAGDRNALMISIRITGYGQEYGAEITCQECGAHTESAFDLASLPIKPLTLSPVEPGQNLFEFVLPLSKKKVRFKYLTGADEHDLVQEQERMRKKMHVSKDNMVTGKLKRSIVSVDGITDRSKIDVFVRNMPARDSRALRNFMDEHEPGIDMKSWTSCSVCGAEQEVVMPLGARFFWPDAR